MQHYLCLYGQPRPFRKGPGQYDKEKVICEKKELSFDANNEVAARRILRKILEKRASFWGGKLYRRAMISIISIFGLGKPAMPKEEFLPGDEMTGMIL